MSDYDSVSDVELTHEHITFCTKAGASDLFIDLLTYPEEKADVDRHSIREEIRKYVYWGKLDADPEAFEYVGGHFFSAMWEGDLFEAWGRADLNNRRLMEACFGKIRIRQAAIQQGKSPEYAEKMV